MLLVMTIVVAVRVVVPAAPAARVPSALPMMVVMALKASARLVMMVLVLVVMLLVSPSAPVMVIVATVPPGVASLGIAPSVAYSTQAVVICVARMVA